MAGDVNSDMQGYVTGSMVGGVADVGDIDGNGFVDIVVGAPRDSQKRRESVGRLSMIVSHRFFACIVL